MAIDSQDLANKLQADESALLINRTGIMLNPDLGAELIQGAKEITPSAGPDGEEIRLERTEYANESPPIGSYPAVVNGEDTDQSEELPYGSEHMAVLLDKLSERLAFERQGTRLYEAFIQKVEAMAIEDSDGPNVEELRHIYDEELEHFKLLQKAIVELGGDATVQSPSADVAGVLSHGAMQIMSDPRTTVAQALQAALTAELADNDGWEMLQDLAQQLGHDDLAAQASQAFEEEQEHLEAVRTWISAKTLAEAVAEDELGSGEADSEEEDGGSTKKPRARSAKKKSSRSKTKRKKK
jgi:hypothetical protein